MESSKKLEFFRNNSYNIYSIYNNLSEIGRMRLGTRWLIR